MSPPNLSAPPATSPSPDDIPDFADLAADPEIIPLLSFDPVVRKIRRPDGWTPELQRELIARLAATGTIQAAVWQMGKHATGAEALYKTPTATSFRASWDAAVIIGRRRNGLDSQPPYQGAVPGIVRRSSSGGRASMATPHPDDDEPDMSEEDKLSLVEGLLYKWLGKVEQEREARLAGEVVAADFYLRQVTFFEVAFDLMTEGFGQDGWQVLNDLRRGGTHITQIAATPMSQMLDAKRRELWEAMKQPERPEHPPARYLLSKLNYSLEPLEYEQGGEEGRKRKAEYARRHEVDAASQLAWEQSQQRCQEHRPHADDP
jgi:hypothetical protein